MLTDVNAAMLKLGRDRMIDAGRLLPVVQCNAEALPFPPKTLNLKPSRIGSVRKLLELYDYCAERRMGCYGGGQFELGPGRGQIQHLASLFHADAPNDVAPVGYHEPEPRAGLAASPLEPPTGEAGFR